MNKSISSSSRLNLVGFALLELADVAFLGLALLGMGVRGVVFWGVALMDMSSLDKSNVGNLLGTRSSKNSTKY